jgi:hypothetical protein
MRNTLAGLVAGLAAAWLVGAEAVEIRYPEVLYLDEPGQPPLKLKTLERTPITFSRDARSTMAYLAKGRTVTVVGFGDAMHYVSTQIATGPARGWVDAAALETPPQELLEKLKKRRDRLLAHREVIARHEVASGMTPDEVLASLGKPERKVRVRSAEGEEEQWLYVTYQYLPQYTQYFDDKGQARQLVYYKRVPSSHKVITFRGGEVAEAADDETRQPAPPGVIVLPPQTPGIR